jgi:hypothetical protein
MVGFGRSRHRQMNAGENQERERGNRGLREIGDCEEIGLPKIHRVGDELRPDHAGEDATRHHRR